MSSSSSSPSETTLSGLDQLVPPSEQLCYVHCIICDTVLAVSVPRTILFKNVTVRCGHCTNLLPVNMQLLFPSHDQFHDLGQNLSSPSHDLMIKTSNPNQEVLTSQNSVNDASSVSHAEEAAEKHPPPQIVNRPPEKRQRVPSAYNRFIKEEIRRIKEENPGISHREAFSTAAKNWAHFPHIYCFTAGQGGTRANVRRQEGEVVPMKDGFLASTKEGV